MLLATEVVKIQLISTPAGDVITHNLNIDAIK